MSVATPLLTNRKWIYLCYLGALALLGGVAVYCATSRFGPGVSTDAAVMLSTAENVARGRGLVNYWGAQLSQFAPLYSLLLALGSIVFQRDVFTVGWALSGASFSAAIWFSGLYFYEALEEERLFAYFASFAVSSSTSLIAIFANIASDPLFLLITILCLMSMVAYLRGGSLRGLFTAGALVILACFQRYAGLALALTGAVVVAFHERSRPRMAVLAAGAFALLTAAPILLWGLLHNLPASGYAFGERQVAIPTVNFTTGVEKLLYWFIPFRVISLAGSLLLFSVLAMALLTALIATGGKSMVRRLARPAVLPSAVFVVVYGAVLIFNISTPELKGIKADRVHIIMLPALLVVLFTAFSQLYGAARNRLRRGWIYGAATVLFVIWASYPISRAYEYVRNSMAAGDVSTYNSINKGSLRGSALARYLKTLDLHQEHLYSNGADSAWFLLHEQIDPMPMLSSKHRSVDLAEQSGRWPGAGQQGYLIWFQSETYKESYATPEELSTIAHVQEVYHDERAAVYRVSPP